MVNSNITLPQLKAALETRFRKSPFFVTRTVKTHKLCQYLQEFPTAIELHMEQCKYGLACPKRGQGCIFRHGPQHLTEEGTSSSTVKLIPAVSEARSGAGAGAGKEPANENKACEYSEELAVPPICISNSSGGDESTVTSEKQEATSTSHGGASEWRSALSESFQCTESGDEKEQEEGAGSPEPLRARIIELEALVSELRDREELHLCQICMENPRDTVIFPCMHFIYCGRCLNSHEKFTASAEPWEKSAQHCPACRGTIAAALQLKLHV